MSHPIPNGFLVVIEGIDGAGKSTVAQRLRAFCDEHGLPCLASREPTDGPWGRKLRESAQTGRLSLEEELELFIKDRREHVEQRIRPALAEGKVVVLDRYYFSTAAYQGARGADPEEVLAANEQFAPQPDLLLLLDADPERTLERVRSRGDVPNEFERESALKEIRRIFLSISRPYLVRINASTGADEVARQVRASFSAALCAKRGLCLPAE
ncbi:dTMP kinase [Verrucomicrobiota bacterium sgz303538]